MILFVTDLVETQLSFNKAVQIATLIEQVNTRAEAISLHTTQNLCKIGQKSQESEWSKRKNIIDLIMTGVLANVIAFIS